jgi:hypothetical protein
LERTKKKKKNYKLEEVFYFKMKRIEINKRSSRVKSEKKTRKQTNFPTEILEMKIIEAIIYLIKISYFN